MQTSASNRASLFVVLATLTFAAGCGTSPTSDVTDATVDAIADDTPTPTDSGPTDAGPTDSGPPAALVRFANFVTNIPAYDICFKPNDVGRPFMGPIFRNAGLAGGLRYGSITEYFPLEARMFAWRIVAPTATDCATPLMDSPPMLYFDSGNIGGRTTVVAAGTLNGSPPNQLRSFNVSDPPTAAPAGMITVHMFSAAIGVGQLELGATSGATFTPIVTAVDYGSTRVGMGMPLAAGTLALRRVGMTALDLQAMNVTIPPTKSRTVFAFGTVADPGRPLGMLLCDNVMVANHLSVCDVFPMR